VLCICDFILVALGDCCDCGFLITLGDCRHLDGWWIVDWWGDLVIVSTPNQEVICEGLLWFPGGVPNSNSSGLLVSYNFSPLVGSCGAFWEARCVIPISHRTTWCRGTQQGLDCRQASEPREKKSIVSSLISQWIVLIDIHLVMIGFLPVIGHHILWLVHLRHGGIKITYLSFTFPQTSCNKLFSVISFERLSYLC
jgi:hypothetical protein